MTSLVLVQVELEARKKCLREIAACHHENVVICLEGQVCCQRIWWCRYGERVAEEVVFVAVYATDVPRG